MIHGTADNLPLVAIALAAYEPPPAWFYEQLRSLQNQSYENFICLVCFDSPMADILARPEFQKVLTDPRFQFAQNESRLGYKLNFERCLQKALTTKAKYIGFCDQDDVWFPNKIERAVHQLEKQPRQLVYCNFRNLNSPYHVSSMDGWREEKRDIRRSRQWDIVVRNVANGCGMMFEAETIRNYSQFPKNIKHHDVWTFLVFEHMGITRPQHNPGFAYRQHAHNQIGSVKYAGHSETFKKFLRNPFAATVVPYLESYSVYRCLEEAKVCHWRTRLLFRYPDFGFFLFLQALIYLPLHPRTARSFLSRALGKMTSQLNPQLQTDTDTKTLPSNQNGFAPYDR